MFNNPGNLSNGSPAWLMQFLSAFSSKYMIPQPIRGQYPGHVITLDQSACSMIPGITLHWQGNNSSKSNFGYSNLFCKIDLLRSAILEIIEQKDHFRKFLTKHDFLKKTSC